MPETTTESPQLAHILLKVSDINRSERFYADLLGFKVRPAKPFADGRPFVPFHGGLALTSGGTAEAQNIDHIAFKVHDVAGIATRVRNAGAKLYRDVHQGIYGLTIYIADPDENRIELFEEGAPMR